MKRTFLAVALSMSALVVPASQAAVILVQDQAIFLSLVSGTVTENFDSIVIPPGGYIAPKTLSTSVGTFTNTQAIYVTASFGLGDGSQYIDLDGSVHTTLTLLPGYTAAGSLVFKDNGGASVISSIVVTDSTNATYTFTNLSFPAATGSPSTRFIGFVSDPGITITSIRYAATNGLCVDNYMVAVPEPSTVATLAFGGVALSLLRLRKRNR